MGSWDRKLERADQHLKALTVAIEAFIATDPYGVVRKLDAEGAEHVYLFDKFIDPPECIGLLVGDVVHNLRTSLDHIVLALAQKGAKDVGVEMTRRAERPIQFPVAIAPEQFEDQIGRRRLRYVEPEAKAVIERLQPYWINQAEPDRSWIAVVNELDVTDKHRTIPSLGAVVSYEAFVVPPGVERPKMVPTHTPGEWGLNAEVARYRFSEPRPDLNMEFSPAFTVAIEGAWPPNGGADVVLANYAECIRQWIIDPLLRFL